MKMNVKRKMSLLKAQKIVRFVIIPASFFALTAHFACEQKANEATEPTRDVFPQLIDSIPYEQLGQGKLVFERLGPQENNYSGVYVIDINNRSSWGIGSGVFDGPTASPNGQKIAFSRLADLDTAFDIHIMDIDGSNIQNVSSIDGQDRSPSWMPDSSQILFWVGGSESPLYRQSPIPNPIDRTLIKTFSFEDNKVWMLEGPFSVSKDLRLTFAAILSYSPWGIYTMDLDGSNLRKIASADSSEERPFSPAWSPDGQEIAFLLSRLDFTSLEIIVVNADGGSPRSLAKFEIKNVGGIWAGENDISLCWSPDGSKIAFNKKEEGSFISHIYVINSDGSGLTQVTFAEGVTDRSLSWAYY
jgi:Tol biopolymer transport system component